MAAGGALARHTLVIPTYNRAELLERLIAYYAKAAPEMPVLVLDSSRDEVKAQNAAMISRRAAQVRHIAYPSTTPMAQKLALGLEEVTTPTASFCADDDLAFPAALEEAIAVVVAQSDYVCAHGVYMNFRETGQTIDMTVEYAGPSIDASHPGARVFRLCQNYESLFYGAFRTPDLLDIMREAGKAETLHFQEFTQSVVAMIKGKVKRLESFYAARRSGPEAEPGRDKWQTYYWFADNPAEFLAHYLVYRDRIWTHYQSSMAGQAEFSLDRNDFDRVMDLSHAVYFGRADVSPYFYERLKPLWPMDDFAAVQQGVVERRLPFGIHAMMKFGREHYRDIQKQIREDTAGPFTRFYARLLRIDSDAVRKLNVETAGRFRSPWRAQFASGWAWLADAPHFRSAYDQLCIYLDGPN